MNNIYTLNMNHAPFNTHYLHRLSNVIHNAVREHPRTTAIRVDLHVPNYKDTGDSISCIIDMNKGLMSRFIEALDARIQIFLKNKSKNGMRVYPCHLRYAWVKEIDKDKSDKPHWHVVLFLNKDAFLGLGDYTGNDYNVASMIQAAWLSALKLPLATEYLTLIHFPDNPCYHLNINNPPAYSESYNGLMYRLSYLAKERTKVYSNEERSFGCSQS